MKFHQNLSISIWCKHA